MTQEGGFNTNPAQPYAVMNTDDSIQDQNKSPSPELFSLIKAAASNLLSFGELWNSIKKKGKDEGFTERELQDILRPLLKPQLNKDQIYYLFNAEEKKEQSKQTYHNRNIPTISPKKVLDQSDEEIEDLIDKPVPVKDSEQFYNEQDSLLERNNKINEITAQEEEPTELELANIKIAQLEDALHKTEQFKPANAFEEGKPIIPIIDDEKAFQYLRDRSKETGNIILIDRVGAGALVQALTQYKRSFTVAELFLRVIQ